MCNIPICLKKNNSSKEIPVSYLYGSDFTTEKDIEKAYLQNLITEEKPP